MEKIDSILLIFVYLFYKKMGEIGKTVTSMILTRAGGSRTPLADLQLIHGGGAPDRDATIMAKACK